MKQSELKQIAISCAQKIVTAQTDKNFFDQPYKHLVIDDFFSSELANTVLSSFPGPESDVWERTNDEDIEIKLRTQWQSEFDIPDGILDAIRILNSSLILNAMSSRFDIQKLIPDPYFTGGGLNATVKGGLLDVHVDGNYHDATGCNRRLNAIVYLNPNWEESWGGDFGLYNDTGDVLIKKVAPIFNRLMIFDTNDFSFHGLPDPLNFPENEARKSLILYYYTKEPRPSSQVAVEQPHSALWKKRGVVDKRGNKTRDFK